MCQGYSLLLVTIVQEKDRKTKIYTYGQGVCKKWDNNNYQLVTILIKNTDGILLLKLLIPISIQL